MNFSFVPDPHELAAIFAQAQAPAFLLAAIIGFISVLMRRLDSVGRPLGDLAKILNDKAELDTAKKDRAQQEVESLKSRIAMLHKAIYLGLGAGTATTLLLAALFVSAFLNLKHVYGGALLFAIACALLAVALYKFAREVSAGIKHMEKF